MLTIYKASAGSGKTFNLAYRYIRQLLGTKLPGGRWKLAPAASRRDRPHFHILAITFTNKATAEMKKRIIEELDSLTFIPAPGDKDSAYAPMLTADFGCAREDLARAADAALRLLLNDYSAFNVSTIDSFFQTVLRSFAREIDRQGDYRLELDRDFAVTTAVTMLFDDVNFREKGVADSVGSWLRDTAMRRLDQGQDFNPFNRNGSVFADLTRYFNKTFDETFTAHAESLHAFLADGKGLGRFADAIDARTEALVGEVRVAAKHLCDALASAGCSTDDLNNSIAALVAKSLDGTAFDDKVAKAVFAKESDRAKYLVALATRDESVFGRGGFFKAKAQPDDAARQALFDWFDTLRPALVQVCVYTAVTKSINTLRALVYINDYINRFRQENNLILLEDTNSLLSSIIGGADAPFIYERVGVELRHFLIDEFQDTSRLQWDNLQPLVANSLASGDDSLIIGDVKQSIYRWRGGDSSLLDHRVQSDPALRDNEVLGTTVSDNTNHRSSHGVVRFNNTVFGRMAADAGVSGYGGATQNLADGTARLPWHINIRHLDSPDEDTLRRRVEALTGSDPRLMEACLDGGAFSRRRAAAVVCGCRIMQQHAAGYSWKEIAVLVRRNDEGAMLAGLFSEYFPEIKIMSSEALMLENAPAVKLIVSMLEIIDRSYAGLLNDFPAADTDGTKKTADVADMMMDRFEYYLAHGDGIDDALDKALTGRADSGPGDETGPSLLSDIDQLRRMAPANLLSMVEAVVSLKIPPAQRMAELPYINAFLDAVCEFSDTHIPTVHAFLEYWATVRHKLSITAPSGLDAVDIMTVHKAKGLERACIHIPFMDWELTARSSSAWFDLSGLTGINPADRPPILYLTPSPVFTEPGSPFREAVADQIRCDSADNLNVAYVAFTRAICELDITLTEPCTEGDGSLADALCRALRSTGLPPAAAADTEALYADTAACIGADGDFTMGCPTAPAGDEPAKKKRRPLVDPEPTAPRLPVFNFGSAASRMARVDDLTTEPAGGLDTDTGEKPPMQPVTDSDADSAARDRGTALHAVLAQMRTAADLDTAVARVAYEMHSAPEGLAAEYRAVLAAAFEAAGEYAARWFGDDTRRVLAEQTVCDTARDENWRPDRIVWTADGHIDIIDYKFTSAPAESHKRQVRGYMNMLRSMGHDGLRGYVWYPGLKLVVPVDNGTKR